MEEKPLGPTPRRRWWRSRKLVYLAVLIGLVIGGILLHDWLFMPEDLRRMQGTWKVAKVLTADDKLVDVGKPPIDITFVGRHVILHDDDRCPLEIRDGKFFLYDISLDEERTYFGFKVHVPIWLRRPNRVIYGTYEYADQQLIFWLKGGANLVENIRDEREDQQLRVYLERR